MPRSTLLAALCAALLTPALAQAATKTVDMGAPKASQKALSRYGADANAFFPATVTIHRGDSVKFVATGFHSIELPAKGSSPLAFTAATGQTISGARDAAGVPYWFNGQPNLEYNVPLLTAPGFGKSFTYDGSTAVRSGLPLGTTPKPVTVRFTKTGTFTYFCNIHPGMKARVVVAKPKAHVPSAKSDRAAVADQVKAAVRTAKALQVATVRSDTIQIGNGGPGGVEVYSFFPPTRTVKVGDTLTFEMSRLSLDVHTATTGPGDVNDPSSFVGGLAASIGSQPPFDQAGVYPSDPRGAPALLTPNLHGNGFWGSGFMDRANATPYPKRTQVKFVAPGIYTFYDLVHPFMKAVVTVG